MYGETWKRGAVVDDALGLSPHVRGNPELRLRGTATRGSIPACTGKPETCIFALPLRRVYPRMYGETQTIPSPSAATAGLSPHVRGNLPVHLGRDRHPGSIPACTGKPTSTARSCRPKRVYPRMYGETRVVGAGVLLWAGLSPHVRGNREVAVRCRGFVGSIPACTGKPPKWSSTSRTWGVYPRMYGETGRCRQPA